MANFNKVILLGNLTRDPERHLTPSGTPVVSFGLAVNTPRAGSSSTGVGGRTALLNGGKTSALSMWSRLVARRKRPVSISRKGVPRSLKGACNGAVGTGRTARNGASMRSWPTGFTSCRGGVRMGWSARVPAPHVRGRRALCCLSRRTIYRFEAYDDGRRITKQGTPCWHLLRL